ncbi:hypothetical protein LAZ67_13000534 [Cordylochernes scorpioides]|uniref:Uncharacterized protein n=1 Tax=Cordylochernes scorpioides TaxID=51811 RepID=A0ABY6L3H8_9ARAC|nr:hypothetical protein LAZ67_13000534 [Cordylochernes scorpioides]
MYAYFAEWNTALVYRHWLAIAMCSYFAEWNTALVDRHLFVIAMCAYFAEWITAIVGRHWFVIAMCAYFAEWITALVYRHWFVISMCAYFAEWNTALVDRHLFVIAMCAYFAEWITAIVGRHWFVIAMCAYFAEWITALVDRHWFVISICAYFAEWNTALVNRHWFVISMCAYFAEWNTALVDRHWFVIAMCAYFAEWNTALVDRHWFVIAMCAYFAEWNTALVDRHWFVIAMCAYFAEWITALVDRHWFVISMCAYFAEWNTALVNRHWFVIAMCAYFAEWNTALLADKCQDDINNEKTYFICGRLRRSFVISNLPDIHSKDLYYTETLTSGYKVYSEEDQSTELYPRRTSPLPNRRTSSTTPEFLGEDRRNRPYGIYPEIIPPVARSPSAKPTVKRKFKKDDLYIEPISYTTLSPFVDLPRKFDQIRKSLNKDEIHSKTKVKPTNEHSDSEEQHIRRFVEKILQGSYSRIKSDFPKEAGSVPKTLKRTREAFDEEAVIAKVLKRSREAHDETPKVIKRSREVTVAYDDEDAGNKQAKKKTTVQEQKMTTPSGGSNNREKFLRFLSVQNKKSAGDTEVAESMRNDAVQLYHQPSPATGNILGERYIFHEQGFQGPQSYRYGYDTGGEFNRQTRFEERSEDGHVRGSYSFVDPSGKTRVVNYEAHPETGFQSNIKKPMLGSKSPLMEERQQGYLPARSGESQGPGRRDVGESCNVVEESVAQHGLQEVQAGRERGARTLLLRCRLYFVKRSVTSSFHGPLQFREQEKVTGGQIWGIRWLRHH